MIYPIRDKQGKPKLLHDIEYGDFEQLRQFDEGLYAEYKEKYNDDVKGHIPKVVCSFANSYGGWMFVGVKNDGSVCDIQEDSGNEFSHTLGQKIMSKVSPLPRYDFQFVKNPNKEGFGVLVLCVEEGYEPPYMYSGSIYVRSGSNSNKEGYFYESAHSSSVLRSLEEKRKVSEGNRLKFFRRDVFFPFDSLPGDQHSYSLPIFSLYLYRIANQQEWIAAPVFDKARDNIEKIVSDDGTWGDFVLQETPHSLVVRQGPMNCMDNASSIIEIYRTGSLKMHVPLYALQGSKKDEAYDKLQSIREIINPERFRAIDGRASAGNVIEAASIMKKLLDTNPFCGPKKDYLIGYEIESCDGVSIYSDNPFYVDFVKSHGIPHFSGGTFERYDVKFWDCLDYMGAETSVTYLAAGFFLEAMGFPRVTLRAETLRSGLRVILGTDGDELEGVEGE